MIDNLDVIKSKIVCFKAGIFDVLSLIPKQQEALRFLKDAGTSEILYGGSAGGGKTWLGCEWLLWNCISYPGTRWFVGRHHLKQIRESTVITFFKVCKKHNIPPEWWKYNEQSVSIKFENGSSITGLELMHKPGDPDFDGFGSTEYTGGWIEEGGGVAYKAYEIAGTRIGRHLNDEYGIPGKLLITGNPSRNWMYSLFYKPWKAGTLDESKQFVQAFVTDNSKRETGYYERLSKLTGQTRERLLLGNWEFDGDPLSLMQYSAITDIYSNDYLIPDVTKKRMVCDVALHGSDLYRVGVFYGDVLVDHMAMEKSGGQDVIRAIKGMQAKHQIRASHILYDADGAGGFVGQKGGFIPGAIPFHGGGAVIKSARDKQTEYGNLKAQCAYLLAEKVNEGLIWARAVTSEKDREMLSEELAQVKKDKADADKLRIMAKPEVKQNLGRSPDFADLFVMKQYFDLKESVTHNPHQRQVA